MASTIPGAQQRFEYLENAADALFTTSPHSAAFLKVASWRVADEFGIDQGEIPVDCCARCGNRLLPGWSSEMTGTDTVQMAEVPWTVSPVERRDMVLHCTWCGGVVTMSSFGPAPAQRGKSEVKSSTPPLEGQSGQPQTPSAPDPSSNQVNKTPEVSNTGKIKARTQSTGNKKRTRKNNKFSLRSMLARSEASKAAAKGHGLDISDLME